MAEANPSAPENAARRPLHASAAPFEPGSTTDPASFSSGHFRGAAGGPGPAFVGSDSAGAAGPVVNASLRGRGRGRGRGGFSRPPAVPDASSAPSQAFSGSVSTAPGAVEAPVPAATLFRGRGRGRGGAATARGGHGGGRGEGGPASSSSATASPAPPAALPRSTSQEVEAARNFFASWTPPTASATSTAPVEGSASASATAPKAGDGKKAKKKEKEKAAATTTAPATAVPTAKAAGGEGERDDKKKEKQPKKAKTAAVPLSADAAAANAAASARAASSRALLERDLAGRSLSERLGIELREESYDCTVCFDRVKRKEAVWACDTCYRVFHLGCIKTWRDKSAGAGASGGAGGEGGGGGGNVTIMGGGASSSAPASAAPSIPNSLSWRCPACTATQKQVPVSKCFCGKVRSPEQTPDPFLVPHTCGQTCGKRRPPPVMPSSPSASSSSNSSLPSSYACPHPCTEPCHAGPCPPCSSMGVIRHCGCKRTSYRLRCGAGPDASQASCGQICGKPLSCGIAAHKCPQVCHTGPCKPCAASVIQGCYCGKSIDARPCGSGHRAPRSRFLLRSGGDAAAAGPCVEVQVPESAATQEQLIISPSSSTSAVDAKKRAKNNRRLLHQQQENAAATIPVAFPLQPDLYAKPKAGEGEGEGEVEEEEALLALLSSMEQEEDEEEDAEATAVEAASQHLACRMPLHVHEKAAAESAAAVVFTADDHAKAGGRRRAAKKSPARRANGDEERESEDEDEDEEEQEEDEEEGGDTEEAEPAVTTNSDAALALTQALRLQKTAASSASASASALRDHRVIYPAPKAAVGSSVATSSHGYYGCGGVCNAWLDCGLHKHTDGPCHHGDCPGCPRLPSRVTRCACGQSSVQEVESSLALIHRQQKELMMNNGAAASSASSSSLPPFPVSVSLPDRATCLDALPTCGHRCGKPLECGHSCPYPCHDGPCAAVGPCTSPVRIACRCSGGASTFPSSAHSAMASLFPAGSEGAALAHQNSQGSGGSTGGLLVPCHLLYRLIASGLDLQTWLQNVQASVNVQLSQHQQAVAAKIKEAHLAAQSAIGKVGLARGQKAAFAAGRKMFDNNNNPWDESNAPVPVTIDLGKLPSNPTNSVPLDLLAPFPSAVVAKLVRCRKACGKKLSCGNCVCQRTCCPKEGGAVSLLAATTATATTSSGAAAGAGAAGGAGRRGVGSGGGAAALARELRQREGQELARTVQSRLFGSGSSSAAGAGSSSSSSSSAAAGAGAGAGFASTTKEASTEKPSSSSSGSGSGYGSALSSAAAAAASRREAAERALSEALENERLANDLEAMIELHHIEESSSAGAGAGAGAGESLSAANHHHHHHSQQQQQGPNHMCLRICNRQLSCGQAGHRCDNYCHSGPCKDCPVVLRAPLKCRCGATQIPPPVPCGTAPPTCSKPCKVPRPCGHTSAAWHTCHFGACPPCVQPTAVPCPSHGALRALPCHMAAAANGLPPCSRKCGKPLPCGNSSHLCERICHIGDCVSVAVAEKVREARAQLDRDADEYAQSVVASAADNASQQTAALTSSDVQSSSWLSSPLGAAAAAVTRERAKDGFLFRNRKRALVGCGQHKCGRPRLLCEHTCVAPCHPEESECPAIACPATATLLCPCGRLSAAMPCLHGGPSSNGQNRDALSEIQLKARSIPCDTLCANAARARLFGEAAGVLAGSQSQQAYNPFPESLVNFASENASFAEKVDKAMRSLLTASCNAEAEGKLPPPIAGPLGILAPSNASLFTTPVSTSSTIPANAVFGSFVDSHTLDLPFMTKPQRAFVHQLAVIYALHSMSMGAEPKRFIRLARRSPAISAAAASDDDYDDDDDGEEHGGRSGSEEEEDEQEEERGYVPPRPSYYYQQQAVASSSSSSQPPVPLPSSVGTLLAPGVIVMPSMTLPQAVNAKRERLGLPANAATSGGANGPPVPKAQRTMMTATAPGTGAGASTSGAWSSLNAKHQQQATADGSPAAAAAAHPLEPKASEMDPHSQLGFILHLTGLKRSSRDGDIIAAVSGFSGDATTLSAYATSAASLGFRMRRLDDHNALLTFDTLARARRAIETVRFEQAKGKMLPFSSIRYWGAGAERLLSMQQQQQGDGAADGSGKGGSGSGYGAWTTATGGPTSSSSSSAAVTRASGLAWSGKGGNRFKAAALLGDGSDSDEDEKERRRRDSMDAAAAAAANPSLRKDPLLLQRGIVVVGTGKEGDGRGLATGQTQLSAAGLTAEEEAQLAAAAAFEEAW